MNKTICYCKKVDKKTIVKAIENGAMSYKEIKKITKAGTGSKCKDKNPTGKCCDKEIKKILEKKSKKMNKGTDECSCCCS